MVNQKLVIGLVCGTTCAVILFANFGTFGVATSRAAVAELPTQGTFPPGTLPFSGPFPQAASPSPQGLQDGLGTVVTTVKPSVVNISVHPEMANQPTPAGFQMLGPFPGRSSWVGSGIIVDPSGYILTSRHVVGNADMARVQLFRSGNNSFLARRVASDPATDLVLLKLPVQGGLPYAVLGDSSSVRTGDLVIALGSPFGLTQTVTQGIVSASRRTVTMENQTYTDVIQTDASINQGNCGGPLVNIQAQVIGVNMGIYSTNSSFAGIGFAVRSNRARVFIQRALGLVQ